MTRPFRVRERRMLLAVLLAILLIRLLTLSAYPLTDTTEARYGEIARKMVELNDWVTPWFDYGVPFWGKPPLAFWLAAGAAKVLGVSEFALRLPSFLLGLGMLALVAGIGRRARGLDQAGVAALVLASSALFFVAAGAVLTDIALAFSITLAMAAFWLGVAQPLGHARCWRYLFFVAMGLGLLAKGPVALIFTLVPIGLWALLTNRLWVSLKALPWISGVALMLALALPWYLTAERHTPGFLNYFLVGENLQRFLDPHWQGDRYGDVHTRPHGTIWLMLLGAALPWTLPALWLGLRALRRGVPTLTGAWIKTRSADPWLVYLFCFGLTPALFFSFAGSVLATYLLPSLPALALLAAEGISRTATTPAPRKLAALALLLPLLFAGLLPLLLAHAAADKSQSTLLAQLPPSAPVAYYPRRPFSGQFYSSGRALQLKTVTELERRVAEEPRTWLVTREHAVLPATIRARYRAAVVAGRERPYVLWAPLAQSTPRNSVVEGSP